VKFPKNAVRLEQVAKTCGPLTALDRLSIQIPWGITDASVWQGMLMLVVLRLYLLVPRLIPRAKVRCSWGRY